MKNNLYLVQSPLQVLCATEAALRNSDTNNILICKLSEFSERSSNNEQIKIALSYGQWDKIEILQPALDSGRFLTHHSISKFIRKLKKNYYESIESLYIGDFRSKWMHQTRIAIEPKSTWLIDDGAASISAIYKHIKKGDFISDTTILETNKLKSIALHLMYGSNQKKLEALKTTPVNVFSAFLKNEDIGEFNINNTEVVFVKNDFNNIKLKLSAKQDSGNKNSEVYYYGSKYSEAGAISLEYEILFLKKVKEHYRKMGLDVRYFPHRDESIVKLNKIEKIFPNRVEYNVELAEASLLKLSVLPVEIAAAYSSVLQNLDIIYPEIKKTSFQFNDENIFPKYQEGISAAYNHYKLLGLNVVRLK